MRKLLGIGMLALAAVALSQQEASAWHKCRFSVGLNYSSEGGGNSVLWGLLKGGPSPGMEGYGGGEGFAPPGAMFGAAPGAYGPPSVAVAPAPAPNWVAPAPAAAPQSTEPPTQKAGTPAQPVSYQQYGYPSYPSYQAPSYQPYYYPGYSQPQQFYDYYSGYGYGW